MRKKLISGFLVFVLLFSLIPAAFAATTFSDVPSSGKWYSEGVYWCAEKGYVSGYENGTFKPEAAISRAELAAIMNRMLKLTEAAENTFSDVPNGKWFTTPILNCVKAGVITGYGKGKFGPADKVTREQAAVILAQALKVHPSPTTGYFDDEDKISGWAENFVTAMHNKNLIAGMGDNKFEPKLNVTRGQVCTILNAARKDNVASPDTTTTGTAVTKLPVDEEYMVFASGAGGWATELMIYEDGSFEGIYYDADAGMSGDGYDGTIYGNTFTGKFKNFRKVSDTQYIMDLDSIKYDQEPWSSEIEDRVLYLYTDAYGICEGSSFTLLLKGSKIDMLPNNAQDWLKSGTFDAIDSNGNLALDVFYTDGAAGPFVETEMGEG